MSWHSGREGNGDEKVFVEGWCFKQKFSGFLFFVFFWVTVIIGLKEWKKTEVLATKPEILKSHERKKVQPLENTHIIILMYK